MVETVRDSSDIYLEMAEEQLAQGRISELFHQRELSIAHHNGLKMCPACDTIHGNEGEYCSLCKPNISLR